MTPYRFSLSAEARRAAAVLRERVNARTLRSFFTKPSADRGKERYRRASLAASASVLSQALAILISIVSVPLTLRYLGQERYGVWLTISSILTWLTMTDFGLTGNALVNLLAEAHGSENRKLAGQYASSAFWALTAITLTMGAVLSAAFNRIPWRAIFRVSAATSTGELQLACGLALAIFILMFPLTMLTSVYSAYQDGFVSNLWIIAGNVFSLTSLLLVTQFHGGLPQLVLALSGTRFIVGIINGYYVFFHRYRWLAPRISNVRWIQIRRMLTLGGKYMVAQTAGLGIGQCQPLIISQVLGPAYVPVFVVTYRLLTLPNNLVFIATLPFVSAYGEAKARGDWKWIKGALKTSTILAASVGLPVMTVVALGAKRIIGIWAGPAAVPDSALIVWLSIYTAMSIILNPVSQMIWGLERVGIPALSMAVCAAATIKLGFVFTRWWGLTGLAAAMTLTFLLIYVTGQLYEVRRALKTFQIPVPQPEPLPELTV